MNCLSVSQHARGQFQAATSAFELADIDLCLIATFQKDQMASVCRGTQKLEVATGPTDQLDRSCPGFPGAQIKLNSPEICVGRLIIAANSRKDDATVAQEAKVLQVRVCPDDRP